MIMPRGWVQGQVQRAGRGLRFSPLRTVYEIGWSVHHGTPQDGNTREAGQSCLEQLQPFATQLRINHGHPCDVPSWPRKGGSLGPGASQGAILKQARGVLYKWRGPLLAM